MTLDHKNNSFEVSFIVLDSDYVPILGLKTSEHLQLIKRVCRIKTNNETFFSGFHDCFGEIGALHTPHHIKVKVNVKPLVTLDHKVPHALKPKLEKELKRMDDLHITQTIKKPTDWGKRSCDRRKTKWKVTNLPRSLTLEQRYKTRTPSPPLCLGNIFTNVWYLLFLKTRCFLGILANKS